MSFDLDASETTTAEQLCELLNGIHRRLEAIEQNPARAVARLEGEMTRRNRWWHTHDAFVTGQLAMSADGEGTGDYPFDMLRDNAVKFADMVHGPL